MSPFYQVKLFIVENVHLEKDALHIYVALLIFVAACLLFGWKARQWKPWLLVLAITVIGEIWDVRDSIADRDPVQPWENWKDIWNTMLVPTMLMLVARFTNIFRDPDAPSGDETEMTAGTPRGEDDIG